MRELLIGSGPSRTKKMHQQDGPKEWQNLTTLDIDTECGADVIHDLNCFPYPFEDNTFDEIHAYEVLEHLGSIGDYKFFFRQFEELWRILVPGGLFFATVPGPKSPWIWGDPGHTRVITPEQIQFLDQSFYDRDEKGNLLKVQSDSYKKIYKGNLQTYHKSFEQDGWSFIFVLRAIK
jgi:SAM-dependent methyltransferase